MNKRKDDIFQWLVLSLGAIIFALGVTVFYQPVSLAPGGASGAAVIVNTLTGLPVGTVMLCINIPLFFLGFLGIGKQFIIRTVYATVLTSVAVDISAGFYSKIEPFTLDPMLCAVAGGALSALGLALVFKNGGSTGGSDILAKIIRKKRRDVQIGQIFMVIDSIIIIGSAFATKKIEIALYSAVGMFIMSKGMDMILYGNEKAKFLVIISTKPQEVAKKLMIDLDVGVTFAEGQGGYTGTDKQIILCAVKKQDYPKVKDMVNKIDPSSFMIVSSAKEVYGEGYVSHGAEEV